MYTKFISVSLHMSLITQDGYSVLMLAALKGRTEVVSLLLVAGANTDLQDKVKWRCDLGILCTQSLLVYHYTCLSSHSMETLYW